MPNRVKKVRLNLSRHEKLQEKLPRTRCAACDLFHIMMLLSRNINSPWLQRGSIHPSLSTEVYAFVSTGALWLMPPRLNPHCPGLGPWLGNHDLAAFQDSLLVPPGTGGWSIMCELG